MYSISRQYGKVMSDAYEYQVVVWLFVASALPVVRSAQGCNTQPESLQPMTPLCRMHCTWYCRVGSQGAHCNILAKTFHVLHVPPAIGTHPTLITDFTVSSLVSGRRHGATEDRHAHCRQTEYRAG